MGGEGGGGFDGFINQSAMIRLHMLIESIG